MKRYRPMAQAVMKTLIAGNYLRMPGPRTGPVIDSHPPSLPNIMIRSNLPCPDNCKKVCSLTCSKECCRRQSGMGSIKQPIQNTARQGGQHFKFEHNTLGKGSIICKFSMCRIQIFTTIATNLEI